LGYCSHFWLIVDLSATVKDSKESIRRGFCAVEIEKILHTQHFDREPEPKIRSEDIARLAYRHWEERQKNHVAGSDLDDWLRAERELTRGGALRSRGGV
jgi:Protein of unknown function (DUF2934)